MIFTIQQPRGHSAHPIPGTHKFLAYCERFDVVDQPSPPSEFQHLPLYHTWDHHTLDYFSGCYVLRRARQNNGEPFGGIIPLTQFRAQADLSLLLQAKANTRLSSFTSFYLSDEFLLNKYFSKEFFYILEHADPCMV